MVLGCGSRWFCVDPRLFKDLSGSVGVIGSSWWFLDVLGGFVEFLGLPGVVL